MTERLCYCCLFALLLANINHVACGFQSSWINNFKSLVLHKDSPFVSTTITTVRPDVWGRRYSFGLFASHNSNGDVAQTISDMVSWSMDAVNGFFNATTTTTTTTTATFKDDDLQRILNEAAEAEKIVMQAIAALEAKRQHNNVEEKKEVSSDIDREVLLFSDDDGDLRRLIHEAAEAENEAKEAMAALHAFARLPISKEENHQQRLIEDKKLLEQEISEMDKVRNEIIKNGEREKATEDVALLESGLAEAWAVLEKRLKEEPAGNSDAVEENKLVSGLTEYWDALEKHLEEKQVAATAKKDRLGSVLEAWDALEQRLEEEPGGNADTDEENQLVSDLAEAFDALEKRLKEEQLDAAEENRLKGVLEAWTVLENRLVEEPAGNADTVEENRLASGIAEAWAVLEKRLKEEPAGNPDAIEENRLVSGLTEAWDALEKRLEEEPDGNADAVEESASNLAEAFDALEGPLKEEQVDAAEEDRLQEVLGAWTVLEKRLEEEPVGNADAIEENRMVAGLAEALAVLEKRMEEERPAEGKLRLEKQQAVEGQAAKKTLSEVVRAASVKSANKNRLEHERVAADAEKRLEQEQLALWKVTMEEDRVAAEKRSEKRLKEERVAAEEKRERAATEKAVNIYVLWHDC